MMRTVSWLLTPLFVLTLSACGDDGSGEDTTTGKTTTDTTGPDMTTEPVTTTDPMTTEPLTTTNPNTTEPMTTEPMTTEPMTTDPTTTTDPMTTTTDTTTGDPVDLSCENYCALYDSGCKDFSEYANNEECLAQCAQWPLGVPNETAGDSLGCRTYHVSVANMVDPALHCPHAGPTGDGTCIDPEAPTCDEYCTTYFDSCTDKLDLYMGDLPACLEECSEWYPGKTGDTAGDSVGCRLYHAGVALGEPNVHCPHAGPGGADICVTAP